MDGVSAKWPTPEYLYPCNLCAAKDAAEADSPVAIPAIRASRDETVTAECLDQPNINSRIARRQKQT